MFIKALLEHCSIWQTWLATPEMWSSTLLTLSKGRLRSDCLKVYKHASQRTLETHKVPKSATKKDNFILEKQYTSLSGWLYSCWNNLHRLCFYLELCCFNVSCEQIHEKGREAFLEVLQELHETKNTWQVCMTKASRLWGCVVSSC